MKKIILLVLLGILSVSLSAQVKKQKPIKLQGKTDNHKISYEMKSDILYFTNADLITYFGKTEGSLEAGAINYLKSYHKEIEYKEGQTTFRNSGERTLMAAIEKHMKALVLAGKAADIVKEGNKPNLFLVTAKCPTDSTKQNFTEKKGRVVIECL